MGSSVGVAEPSDLPPPAPAVGVHHRTLAPTSWMKGIWLEAETSGTQSSRIRPML